MGSRVRFSLLALMVGAIVAVLAPAAAQASFGVESFFAANCTVSTCGEVGDPGEAPETPEPEEFFTQAGGHPNYGVTDFKLKSKQIQVAPFAAYAPEGSIEGVRVDVPAGLSTNPQAAPMCSQEEYAALEVPTPGSGIFTESECEANTAIGTNKLTILVEPAPGLFANVHLTGTVYNLDPPKGLPAEYGVAIPLESLGAEFKGLYAHTLIEGGVEWNTDYHEYFVIKNISKTLPLLRSRLIFEGQDSKAGVGFTGEFLTNPTSCKPSGPATTTNLKVNSYEGEVGEEGYTTPIGAQNCLGVPFAPTFAVKTETTKSDAPDAVTAELSLPHGLGLENIDSSDLKTATVTLPEGLTLNPSAAAGLEGCTAEQIGIGTTNAVACPSGSQIGTVAIEVPTLPAKSLEGKIYLGKPKSTSIEKPPYTIYLDAESERYGQSVRLEGTVEPDPATGRLTTTFASNPEAPFNSVILNFNGRSNNASLSPLANPLVCGTATTVTTLTPTSGTSPRSPQGSFVVDSDGKGGACPSPLPFSPSQANATQVPNAGAHTNYTFTLTRPEGQQYLSRVETILPAGLVGAISTVPVLCTEAQATAESCPAESLLGKVTVTSGSGSTPFTLTGSVYLTGPYQGAPYGMFISVPVVAGPFDLGNAITRAKIDVNQKSGRVIVSSNLPTIVKGGVPVRLRSLTMEINRPNFLSNPTSCGVLATESTVTGLGSPGTSVSLSSPFQVANCSALAFKPAFKASTGGNPTKAGGASLETTINETAGQANIKSVVVQLPVQLPSRLTTLQKACAQATFEANPLSCPAASMVGSVRANTPVLPNQMTGPAYLVGHAGAAFPDLDLVLQGNGVRVILVGNTDIKKGITTTTFASTPDVPVTSITVNLPMGPHSALAAFGSLCAKPLVMPTTIVGQNGVTVKQNTIIKPVGCGMKIVGHKVIGNTAYITVQTPEAGRVSGGGAGLGTVFRHLTKAYKAATVKVSLTRRGQSHSRPYKVRLRVGFLPKSRGRAPSSAFVTVTFR